MKNLADLKTTSPTARTLHQNTAAEDAAIDAGIAQDPDTYEPSSSEIAHMKKPSHPLHHGDTAAPNRPENEKARHQTGLER